MMTYTARSAQKGKHESSHAAAALYLGKRVVLVSRLSDGELGGGEVQWVDDGVAEDAQAIYLMAAVEMEGSTGWDPSGHRSDLEKAQALGDVSAALTRCRKIRLEREYQRLLHEIDDALWRKPVLTRTDIDAIMARS